MRGPACLKGALPLALLLSAQVQADRKSYPVMLHTDPPRLAVYRVNPESIDASGDQLLGTTDQPLHLELAEEELQSPWQLYFVYLQPGASPSPPDVRRTTVAVRPADLIRPEGFPRDGVYRPILFPSERLDFTVRTYPWLVVVALGALGAAGAGLSWRFLRPGRQRKGAQARRTELLAVTPREDPLVGEVVHGYLLLDRLGRGGNAVVYRAVPYADPDEEKAVAIKMLAATMLEDLEFRTRFQREVRAYQGLVHPNIVRMIDFSQHGRLQFIVLELLQGDTLYQRVKAGPMEWPEAHRLVGQIIDALAYAHEKGVLHRDLKPENLMLCPGQEGTRLVLMDFGLARASDMATITQTGVVVGTPAYMAPEQIHGKSEPATDQFALGTLIYEMLSGQLPLPSPDPVTQVMNQLHKPPRPLREVVPGVPAELEEVVMRMMEKEPGQRFANLREVQERWSALASLSWDKSA